MTLICYKYWLYVYFIINFNDTWCKNTVSNKSDSNTYKELQLQANMGHDYANG